MKAEKKKKARKVVVGILIAYLVIVAVAYVVVSMYYTKHFYSGSQINGIDCTGKTVEDIKEVISDRIQDYTFKIKEKDGKEEKITAVQMKMQYVEDGKIQELKDAQNPFLWFLSFTNHKEYTMSATKTYDKAQLNATIDSLACFQEANIVAPVDAALTETETGYEVTKEVMGNTLDKPKVVELITTGIDQGKTEVSLEEADAYIKPTIYSDNQELVDQAAQLNAYLAVTINYSFGDRKETVDKKLIKSWIARDEAGTVTLDQAKVAEYVHSLAIKYDTFGQSREFKTSLGTTVSLKGGDYGWVINKEKETAALVEAIQTGASQDREPIYLYKGKDRSANDIGGTYVEVSIQNQRMWCYKDGQLIVDTPVVTGNPSRGFDTPAGGVWAIDAKKRDTFLKGQGYNSGVSYWMPFNGGVGIHDASWRPNLSDYGGDIYKTRGSHGCVNTPFEYAEKIYNNVEIGSPVVVY